MIYPYLRLDCDGLDSLVIDLDGGYEGQTLDLGDAITREQMQDAPDADGTIDTTAYAGARSVTLNVTATGDDVWTLEQRLRAFTHPRRRPTLVLQQSATAPMQRITLRRSRWNGVIGGGDRDNGADSDTERAITVQWVAPSGIIESDTLNVASAPATVGSGAEGGRTFDHTFDTTYTGGTIIGQIIVTNAGTADVWPLIRVYGPCTNPVISNITTGKQLAFTGLTINVGEFLEIDTGPGRHTIYYLGDPTQTRYSYLAFSTSQWWSLAPGDNVIRFVPATYSIPSAAEFSWRDAWL